MWSFFGRRARAERRVRRALREVARARDERWVDATGRSLEPALARPDGQLRDLLARPHGPEAAAVVGMLTRWVADWIPDVRDPLLTAVHRIAPR